MTFQYPAVSRRNLMKSVAAAGLLLTLETQIETKASTDGQ